jgi:peptidoglycan/LPS O-acetylase OafA/YrhL
MPPQVNQPPPAQGPSRLDGIDVLRGVACLMVVLFHAGMYWQGALWQGWGGLLAGASGAGWLLLVPVRLGFLGVGLFLVLSGFCLHYPNAVRQRGPGPFRSFIAARALRILPPYLVSMLALWLLVPQGGVFARATFFPIRAWDLWVHALLLHNLHDDTIWTINGAYWSLALEWQLYWVFPALGLLLARTGPLRAALVTCGISVIFPLAVQQIVGEASLVQGWWAVVFDSLPAHLFEFTCGMVAAELMARNRVPPRALLAALSVLWLPVSWGVWETRGIPYPADKVICGVSFGALALLVGKQDLGRGLWARAAMLPGIVSYSLYLVHQPILLMMRPTVAGWALGAAPLWGVTLGLAIPGLIAVAWVFHLLFERPFLRGHPLRDWLDARPRQR